VAGPGRGDIVATSALGGTIGRALRLAGGRPGYRLRGDAPLLLFTN